MIYVCTLLGCNVTSLLGHENQLYVGTSSGNVEVYDSECGILVQKYSLHCAKVRRILKLPPETHRCICAELFPADKTDAYHSSAIVNISSRLANTCEDVTPKKRTLQQHCMQQRSGSSLPCLSSTAPLIVSIGDGSAKWLKMDSTIKAPHANLELLTWTGYGNF